MQENTKTIQVKLTEKRKYRTEPIYQYDVGHELVFEGFGELLPAAFQVHFAHSPMGDAVTQIGQNGACSVPDMYAQTAAPIYAWLYIAESETGLTKYTVEIPVQRRAAITEQQPTPVERSAIDQEIAALNAGVERAEDAAEAAEAAQAGAEAAEQGASAAEDSAGASAALAAQKAELATQEADRAQTALDGALETAAGYAQAASGSATAAAGSAGAAAGSATAADQSAQAAAQKKEQMDVRADEIEEQLTSLMSDIQAKQDAPSVAGTAGQVFGLDAQLHPVWVDQTGGGGVSDVQVNGQSVVTDGVANVPIAQIPSGGYGSNLGVVKIRNGYDGLVLNPSGTDVGRLCLYPTPLEKIKAGNDAYLAVTTLRQHQAVFYGLAKVAGASMESSSNPVGTYTDEAKAAIRAMLGIREWQSAILTLDNYDATLGAFVLDVGSGNEMAEVRVAGQVIFDEATSTYALMGFGNVSGRTQYNVFCSTGNLENLKRLMILANGYNMNIMNAAGELYRRTQWGEGFFGTSSNTDHGMNVDINPNRKMATEKGTSAYTNWNNPRYFSIYTSAVPDWAHIQVDYILR